MPRNFMCDWRSCVSIAALTSLCGIAAAQPAYHDILTKTGDALAGAPGVVSDSFWDQTHMSPTGGRVFFSPYLKGAGVTLENYLSFFAGTPDSPQLVFRGTQQAPGLAAGFTIRSWYAPSISDAGQLTVIGLLKGPGITENVNDRVIYSGTPGAMTPWLRDGQAAPLIGGGTLVDHVFSFTSNSAGQTCFIGLLTGAGVTADVNDEALYYGPVNNLQLMLRRGSQAAGVAAGVKYDWIHVWQNMSQNGKVGFVANLIGAGVNGTNDQAVYMGTPGNLTLMLRKGSQAPGQGAGVVISSLDLSYGINNLGSQTVVGQVSGSGVSTANDTVIIAATAGGPAMVAREGTQAAGLPNNVFYGSLDWGGSSVANIGAGNRIMLAAELKGNGVTEESDTALWTGTAGSLQLVAREGDVVPGHGGSIVWGDLTYARMSSNSAGQVVFGGRMRNLNTAADQWGIFMRETNGAVRSLVQTGDTLMVAPGDYRTVQSATLGFAPGGQMNGKTVLTDAGMVLGEVRFTNDTFAVVMLDSARVCPADFDSSGFVDTDDYDAFVSAFEAGISKADFDKSGFVDTDDFDAFVQAFEDGC